MLLFFVSAFGLNLLNSQKAISLKNDPSQIIVVLGQTVRLRSASLPESPGDEGIFSLKSAPNGYYIKHKNNFLCKKSKEDPAVIGCKSKNSSDFTVWKLIFGGELGIRFQTSDDLCLIPVNFDQREKTKGNFLHARPCTDESYLWEIEDLNLLKDEPKANGGNMMMGNTEMPDHPLIMPIGKPFETKVVHNPINSLSEKEKTLDTSKLEKSS